MNRPGARILIFIEDGTYILDHRVRREAGTLQGAGYQVSVICPRYEGERRWETVEGVHVYRYWKPGIGEGFVGHVLEYVASLFFGGMLSLWVAMRHGFDVLQLCNPPDFLFPIGMMHKLFGKKVIFDHHDLCPELYESRFGGKNALMRRVLLFCERRTLRHAHHVLTTNESYRRIAMERAGISGLDVTVVRNGPSLARFDRNRVTPASKKEGRVRVGYVGNMNPQDGVDLVLEVSRILADDGCDSIEFICVGGGDSLPSLREQVDRYGLADRVTFTGRISDEELLSVLTSCDLGIQPDPKNPLNDVSTMNKVMEYMALSLPVVAFDLVETRVSCGDAALYANPGDLQDLARKIRTLAENPETRKTLGRIGRERITERLAWKYSEPHLLSAYENVLARGEESPALLAREADI